MYNQVAEGSWKFLFAHREPLSTVTSDSLSKNWQNVDSGSLRAKVIMEKISGVYEIINKINGHRYIGSSANIDLRLKQHKWALLRGNHVNPILQNAWNKHGEDAFAFEPVLICDPDNTLIYEQICLDGLCPEYNLASDAIASARGRKHSKETRKKMSQALIGNSRRAGTLTSDQARDNMRNAHIGKVLPEDQRAKISAALKGKKKGVISEEHKRKISAALKGSTIPEEQRRKMSESQKLHWVERKAKKMLKGAEQQMRLEFASC